MSKFKQEPVTLEYSLIMNVLNRAQELVILSHDRESKELSQRALRDLERAMADLGRKYPELPVDPETALFKVKK